MAPIQTELTPLLLHLTLPTSGSLKSSSIPELVSRHAAQSSQLLVRLTVSFALEARQLEALLGSIYGPATGSFVRSGRLTAGVDVVIDSIRKMELCWGGRKESVTIEEDGAKGKEKAHDPPTGTAEGGNTYEVAALGGTFDHLHAGHKILLSLGAYLSSKRLIVGVTDDALLQKKAHKEFLESIAVRRAACMEFLELFKPGPVYDVVAISDVYGPTAWDKEVQALIISDETRGGGDAVSEERKRKGLNALEVYIIDLIGDDGKEGSAVEEKMGSTGIRRWLASQRQNQKL